MAGPSEQLPVALKSLADASAQTIGNLISDAVKFTPPPAPLAAPAQTTPAVADDPAKTGFKIVNHTPAPKITRLLTPEEKLNRAGQIAMDRMLSQANKYPDAYGFLPEDDYTAVKLGQAIPVYNVAEEDRAAYQTGQSVKPLLQPAQQWVFPVLAGDRICCMVQVHYNGHSFVPGNATKSLAMAWNKILDKWPEAEGYHPLLVVNPEIPGYFFTIPELPTPNLTDADQMFYLRPSLSPADVILASWR